MTNHRRVYLAARYSRREELLGYGQALKEHGFEITSHWLEGSHRLGLDGLSVQAEQEERARFAQEDYADVVAADIVVSFTEEPRSTPGRGGRHTEYGIALALSKRCLVVGPRETVFHCLPQAEVYPDWPSALTALTTTKAQASTHAFDALIPHMNERLIDLELNITGTCGTLLMLRGVLRLVLRHPNLTPSIREWATSFAYGLETKLMEVGFITPEGLDILRGSEAAPPWETERKVTP